jgi:hypothetical protein
MVAYDSVKKSNFLFGGRLSRKDLRALWERPNSVYRTTLEMVKDQSVWQRVREVLPGQTIDKDDAFLANFINSVETTGYCAFDTEREVHPVMVQVQIQAA